MDAKSLVLTIRAAWSKTLHEVFQCEAIPNEATLQARFVHHIAVAEPKLEIVCEPAIQIHVAGQASRFQPDVVVSLGGRIRAYIELKMSLLGCVPYHYDLTKLKHLANNRSPVNLRVDPRTGGFIKSSYLNSDDCLAVFGVVVPLDARKGNCDANDEEARKLDMDVMGDRWVHLTPNEYPRTLQ